MGVSKDVKHLAEWWGIKDEKFVSYYFSSLTDLEDQSDEDVAWKSLQDMCASVLERDLPKLKEKNASKRKEMRKRGNESKPLIGDVTGSPKK